MGVSRSFGESIPNEGCMRVQYDDSIVQDTAAEKEQDMREVGVTMAAWEYRVKWYGEEESVARARASEIGTGASNGKRSRAGLPEAVSALVTRLSGAWGSRLVAGFR